MKSIISIIRTDVRGKEYTELLKLEEMEKRLKIGALPARWRKLDESITESDFKCVQKEWIEELNDIYGLFPKRLPEVLKAAEKVRENELLCRYTVLLQKAMADRSTFRAELPSIILPQTEEKNQGYDLMPLFALLPHIPKAVEAVRRRKIPEDILAKTYLGLERILDVTQIRLGRPVYDETYFAWAQHFLDGTLFSIGRLEFEVKAAMGGNTAVFQSDDGAYCLLAEEGLFNRAGYVKGTAGQCDDLLYKASVIETEQYFEGYAINIRGNVCLRSVKLDKTHWHRLCGPESPVIGVHIPMGPGLTGEAVHASYRRAESVFAASFPEYDFRGFCCHSWLMDPQLSDLLLPESNIVRFQSDYLRCPVQSDTGCFYIFVSGFWQGSDEASGKHDLGARGERTYAFRKVYL